MKFIPNSPLKAVMLKEIGFQSVEELFSDIPKKTRIKKLNLPLGLTQKETEQRLREIAKKNKSFYDFPCFLGGGIKQHYIPSIVKSIIARSEFYSSYTPYQPEASQGLLQALFEYQSMISDLTGMDIANCSLYDGATALSEAALMCYRLRKKKNFVIPRNISWEKKSILKNYSKGLNIEIKEVNYDYETGEVDIQDLNEIANKDTAGVYVENPNFFGVFEKNVKEICSIVKDVDSLFVVGVDPISLGIIQNPGSYGADIVVGEGRALGNFIDFGGCSLGIFACKKEFIRQIPGRLISMTKDTEGRRAFCMALQTREQHIRRGRATSNICTNEGLCALAALSYLAWLGGAGLEKLSRVNFEYGQKLAHDITSLDAFEKVFHSTHFNEFVVKSSTDTQKINKKLLKHSIHGGLALSHWFPELEKCLLFGVSELHREEDMKRLVSSLKEASNV